MHVESKHTKQNQTEINKTRQIHNHNGRFQPINSASTFNSHGIMETQTTACFCTPNKRNQNLGLIFKNIIYRFIKSDRPKKLKPTEMAMTINHTASLTKMGSQEHDVNPSAQVHKVIQFYKSCKYFLIARDISI